MGRTLSKGNYPGGKHYWGLIFGIGWGLLGYCPGTSAGALGEGRWDAVWGILGMLAGAAIYAEAYPGPQEKRSDMGEFWKDHPVSDNRNQSLDFYHNLCFWEFGTF